MNKFPTTRSQFNFFYFLHKTIFILYNWIITFSCRHLTDIKTLSLLTQNLLIMQNKYIITVTLLSKIERIRRIVTAINVVRKEAWVPFGFNCWQPSLPSSEEIFITGNSSCSTLNIVKIKITIVTPITSYTNLATLKLDTHSSVQTLIDFTRTLLTFRFVIASMRSMLFECLDNFLWFSLSSRTSPLWKHSVLF